MLYYDVSLMTRRTQGVPNTYFSFLAVPELRQLVNRSTDSTNNGLVAFLFYLSMYFDFD